MTDAQPAAYQMARRDLVFSITEQCKSFDLGAVRETWRQLRDLPVDDTLCNPAARHFVEIRFGAEYPGPVVRYAAGTHYEPEQVAAISLAATIRRLEVTRYAIVVDALPAQVHVPVEVEGTILM